MKKIPGCAGIGCLVVFLLVIAAAIIIASFNTARTLVQGDRKKGATTSAASSPAPVVAQKPGEQPSETLPAEYDLAAKKKKLAEFIKEMQQEGVYGDVSIRDGIGRVVAGPEFYDCNFDQKQKFISAIYVWCRLETDDETLCVVVYDRMNNKEIGRYYRKTGLQMK